MSYLPLSDLALTVSGAGMVSKSDSGYVSTFSNLVLKLRLSSAFQVSLSHAWDEKSCLSCIFHVYVSAPLEFQSATSSAITQKKSYVGTVQKRWSSMAVNVPRAACGQQQSAAVGLETEGFNDTVSLRMLFP